jgi:Cu+-exporting ATPase
MDLAQLLVVLSGALLLAGLAWYFFGPRNATQARRTGGVQEVEITVKGGYSPDVIRLVQGVPARLTFDRQESGDCTSMVVFPDLQLSRHLPAHGRAVVEFTPTQTGRSSFGCAMNMVRGTLVVEPSGSDGTSALVDGEPGLELVRTLELLDRFLPAPPARSFSARVPCGTSSSSSSPSRYCRANCLFSPP